MAGHWAFKKTGGGFNLCWGGVEDYFNSGAGGSLSYLWGESACVPFFGFFYGLGLAIGTEGGRRV